ncbi:dephospho-CoA kinase [uncultured Ferrimonas sp.]|uniref:dephospho-CoA kinase n=1 Tax=uncultured Ferrimonas sp. TaxID=432640 RepID=UPI0026237F39|nr:dephospho-CoA kinase [uncultured Ferrimonas sp.]
MKPLIIGLTGGIGSGKTQVSDHFGQLGATVVDTDIIARQVVAPGSKGLATLVDHFGKSILQPNGALDRAALRQIVFNDHDARQWLNQLTHPLIRQQLLAQCRAATTPYVIAVVPLLLEGDMHQLMDRIAVVDVDEATQIRRTTLRDNNDAALVKNIIASQIDRQSRLQRADDIIDNSRDLKHLQHQVELLHQHYLRLTEN